MTAAPTSGVRAAAAPQLQPATVVGAAEGRQRREWPGYVQALRLLPHLDKGGKTRQGPNLFGIVGRDVRCGERFQATRRAQGPEGAKWDFDKLLAKYLHNPREAVPGNRMAFRASRRTMTWPISSSTCAAKATARRRCPDRRCPDIGVTSQPLLVHKSEITATPPPCWRGLVLFDRRNDWSTGRIASSHVPWRHANVYGQAEPAEL